MSSNKLRAAADHAGHPDRRGRRHYLLSLGDGVTRFVADQFSGLGTNLVFIPPEQGEPGPPGSESMTESS